MALLAAVAALVTPACTDGSDDADAARANTFEASKTPESAESSDVGAFCEQAQGLKDDGQRLSGREAQHAIATRFTAMAEVAPPEIRSDVEVLKAMWVDADENDVVLSIGGEDAAENLRPYSEFRARHPKAPEAGPRFAAYVGEECGSEF